MVKLIKAVAISGDGNTVVSGGPWDDTIGAIYVFGRVGTAWSQEGPKLVGTGGVGYPALGYSVAISTDGSTIASGGFQDSPKNVGAVWIFVRSGTTWTQQGSKLVGTGYVGTSGQGGSVSLSSDGNTLAVGGATDNASNGAAWIFVRSGVAWSQQGSKLIATSTGATQQGCAMSLSGDGNTLAMGAYEDNNGIGATYIFVRSGSVWQETSRIIQSVLLCFKAQVLGYRPVEHCWQLAVILRIIRLGQFGSSLKVGKIGSNKQSLWGLEGPSLPIKAEQSRYPATATLY